MLNAQSNNIGVADAGLGLSRTNKTAAIRKQAFFISRTSSQQKNKIHLYMVRTFLYGGKIN
jgi:hypothetical protein